MLCIRSFSQKKLHTYDQPDTGNEAENTSDIILATKKLTV